MSAQNAAFTDIGDKILSNTPWFLLYVIGVTFLVLAMAFRSLVIALKAALTTLLSALVGFGVLTFIVQLGHGMGVVGLDRTGPIESFVPPIAFAILFGLSTDYEVFLMSRDPRGARARQRHVARSRDGVAGVGRVIVAASLIMSTVFFAFLLSPDRVSKEFGAAAGHRDPDRRPDGAADAGAGAADACSASAPGGCPRWLDRMLPNLTIEPPAERDSGQPVRGPISRRNVLS